MPAALPEKTQRYGMMLAAALEATSIGTDRRGEEVMEMASAYRDDGDHFLAAEDLVNALAAYSYGYGWLDAGVRMGMLETDEDSTLFTQ